MAAKTNRLDFDQVDTRRDNAISVVYIVYEVPKALKFSAWKVFQNFLD